MDVSKIVYGKKFTLEVPNGELSDEGQYEILNLIEGHTRLTVGQIREALPEDWSWEWKVAHGTYAGTLSKRIQSLVFKKFDVKLIEAMVTAIGNSANQHTLQARSFLFDFDNKLDWAAGDFGDDGSCFWTEKSYILPTLAHFGGFSLRLYQTDDKGRDHGSGRCLIMPYSRNDLGKFDPAKWLNPDALLVFNGYGKDMDNYGKSKVSSQRYGNMQVLDYARLLALFLGVSYQRVRTRVNASSTSPLFINNEGMAVAVGQVEVVKPWLPAGPLGAKRYTTLDVVWDKTEIRKFMVECANCSRMCSVTPIGNMRKLVVGPDEKSYCQDCYESIFVPCFGGCGKRLNGKARDMQVTADRLGHVPRATNGGHIVICADCRPRVAFQCALCRHWHHLSDRVDYHIANAGRQPKRSYVCTECDRNRVHTALCPTCTRTYPVAQLTQRIAGHLMFTQCPQCRHRAKKKAVGEKDEDVGAEFVFVPITEPVAPKSIDELVALVVHRFGAEYVPKLDFGKEQLLPTKIIDRLYEYADYIDRHGWRPTAREQHFLMTLPITAECDWFANPKWLVVPMQRYIDEKVGEGILRIKEIKATDKTDTLGAVRLYFETRVGLVDGLTDMLFSELITAMQPMDITGQVPDVGDTLEIDLGYLQRTDNLLAMTKACQFSAEILGLGWPYIKTVTADYDNQRITIQF